MLTAIEGRVWGILEAYRTLDTDEIIQHCDADPMEIPQAIGGLMKKGMISVRGYHFTNGNYAPYFGVA